MIRKGSKSEASVDADGLFGAAGLQAIETFGGG